MFRPGFERKTFDLKVERSTDCAASADNRESARVQVIMESLLKPNFIKDIDSKCAL